MASLILVGPLWSADSQGSDLVREAHEQGHEIILLVPAGETEPAEVHALSSHLVCVEAPMESAEAGVEAVAKIAALGLRPVAIFPANECGVQLAARVGTSLGLAANPVRVGEALRNKAHQRMILEAAGFPTPRFARFTDKAELESVIAPFQFPVVMKPVDGLGKVGVIKAYEIHDNAIARDMKEALRKLKAARYVADHPGEVCPAKWKEGDKTLKPSLDLVGKI